jgi:hypothetical protein
MSAIMDAVWALVAVAIGLWCLPQLQRDQVETMEAEEAAERDGGAA